MLGNHVRGCHGPMHFHIAHPNFFRSTSFRIQGVPMNKLTPMKIVLGVQGNLNWIPGGKSSDISRQVE